MATLNTASLDPVQAAIDKWTGARASAERITRAVPLTVLASEAVELAHFVESYWEPQGVGDRRLPGLSQVSDDPLLHAGVGRDLFELQLAMLGAHARYRLATERAEVLPVERVRIILTELKLALAFAFRDGSGDEVEERLRRLERAHAKPASVDALAYAVESFSHLANAHRARLAALPEFDAALIDEALVAARALRIAASHRRICSPDDGRQALALRNHFVSLLLDRLRRVRAAARYVFRHHPDIAQKACSSHERRRRARSRRRQKAAGMFRGPTRVT